MRATHWLSVGVLFLAVGCKQAKPNNTERPREANTAPVSAPASAAVLAQKPATPASASAPVTAESLPALDPASFGALADAMISRWAGAQPGTPPAVAMAYSVREQILANNECDEGGDGSGDCTVVFYSLRAGVEAPKPLSIFDFVSPQDADDEDDEDAAAHAGKEAPAGASIAEQTAKARPVLIEFLRTGEYRALPVTNWPSKALRVELPGGAGAFSWAENTLSVSWGTGAPRTKKIEAAGEKRFIPTEYAYAPGLPVIAVGYVEVDQDGEIPEDADEGVLWISLP